MAIALLLIESDEVHRQAVKGMLAERQPVWHLDMAASLGEAQELLGRRPPDVALVASRLAGDARQPLLASLGPTPAILLIDEGEEALAAQGLREGFSDYLIKDARHGYLHTLPGQVLAAIDKVRLERALRESATLAELALAGADLGFWQRNLQTGEATLSHRWQQMLGMDRAGSLPSQQAWAAAVHPDDWPLLQQRIQQYLEGGSAVYEAEYRMRHRDGHWIWVASRGRVMESSPDGKPLLICGTYMDVTARRAADQALERQRLLLRALSQAQSTFIANLQPHAAFDGLLQLLLDMTGALAGCLGEVVRGGDGSVVCLVHSGTRLFPEALHRWVEEAVRQPLPVTHTLRPADDGLEGIWHILPVASGERVVAFMALHLPAGADLPDLAEITPVLSTASQLVLAWRARLERRQTQDQLRETSELLAQKTRALELTLDSMTQGITNVDAGGRVQVYNRRYLELLDLPETLMAGHPMASEVVQLQVERGDFGPGYELVDLNARNYVEGAYTQVDAPMPERYLRRTRSGQVIEVFTRQLAGGGRVRTFTDVTAYMQAQEALRQSEERWRSLSALSSDWYWEQDEHFRFVKVDGQQERRMGVTESFAVGRARWELEALNVTEAGWAEHRRAVEAHEVFLDFELQRNSMIDNSMRWLSVSGAPIFDAEGRFRGYRGVGRDITEKKKAEAIIERLAFYDELTSLPNRRLLLVRLAQALADCQRDAGHGALLFLDLDNFKDLNDTLGHDRGDMLLSQVATRLVACVRTEDTVARLGGDEFVLVLTALGHSMAEAAMAAETVAHKILNTLNQPYPIADSLHHSTPSVGIAMFGNEGLGADELLKRGDLAMYQAKAAGRNTLCFYDPGMQEAVSARSAMEADLRQALQRNEFRLLYQPVVDGSGRMLGVEALLRWGHPQRGNISPAEFIPLAEKTGLILPLGRWVLQTACRQLVGWSSDPRMAHLSIAVNVSAREFRDPGFVEAVVAVLESTGAKASQLKLELTESLLLNDVEDIIAKMTLLQLRGVGFSLDDFGTGYSSLSYLKRLPLDQLKIDQSFVRDVLTDPNDATIARTIIALASSLGLAVVAEGVENAGQRAFLLRNGCNAFQGYHFSRPVPAVSLLDLLQQPLGT